jgi:hypothetical protein
MLCSKPCLYYFSYGSLDIRMIDRPNSQQSFYILRKGPGSDRADDTRRSHCFCQDWLDFIDGFSSRTEYVAHFFSTMKDAESKLKYFIKILL